MTPEDRCTAMLAEGTDKCGRVTINAHAVAFGGELGKTSVLMLDAEAGVSDCR